MIPRLDVLVRFAYTQSIAALNIRLHQHECGLSRSPKVALTTDTWPGRTCAAGVRQSNLGAPFDQAESQSCTQALNIHPRMPRPTRCSQSLRLIDTLLPCTCDSTQSQQTCMQTNRFDSTSSPGLSGVADGTDDGGPHSSTRAAAAGLHEALLLLRTPPASQCATPLHSQRQATARGRHCCSCCHWVCTIPKVLIHVVGQHMHWSPVHHH